MGEALNASRNLDVRYIGCIGGRYVLASRARLPDAATTVFACRIKSITPRRAVFDAPVCGAKGEWATAQFSDLGVIKFQIEDRLDFGFSGLIEATEDERAKLAAKIEWVKRKAQFSWVDQREHRRVIPRNPRSRLLLADGSTLDCFLVDISCSGAAVSADLTPWLGMPMAIGKVVCRVVRTLDVGFAVKFVEAQDQDAVEGLLAAC